MWATSFKLSKNHTWIRYIWKVLTNNLVLKYTLKCKICIRESLSIICFFLSVHMFIGNLNHSAINGTLMASSLSYKHSKYVHLKGCLETKHCSKWTKWTVLAIPSKIGHLVHSIWNTLVAWYLLLCANYFNYFRKYMRICKDGSSGMMAACTTAMSGCNNRNCRCKSPYTKLRAESLFWFATTRISRDSAIQR